MSWILIVCHVLISDLMHVNVYSVAFVFIFPFICCVLLLIAVVC